MLQVTAEDLGHAVILRCAGRMVRGEETALLCAAVQQPGRDLLLDLSAVTAIDAAGIGALVALQAAGIYVTLVNPTPPLRQALQLTGLGSMFEVLVAQGDAAFEGHALSA